MGESSLPVWACLLMSGAVVAYLMGYFSPFVPKAVRKKIDRDCIKYCTNENLTVKIRYRFGILFYVICSCVATLAVLIAYLIENSALIMRYSGSSVLLLIILGLIALWFLGIVFFILIFTLAEAQAESSMRRYYKRRYGAKMSDEK